MKMVKSLLLGSAAGLVAVTAGQAADLPVKAKPVEYVKICSLYGAGFYYMPGTDLCIKVGGWVRAEAAWGVNGSLTWGPFNNNVNNRTTSNEAFRARGYITADVRNQTEYGTVRGYIAVGVNTNDIGTTANTGANSFSSNRAFVQWAGMTAGLSQSFFDFYSPAAMQYRGGFLPASDTGDPGWFVWAYTAQLGNGWSATLSTEARRSLSIVGQSSTNALIAGSSIAPGGNGVATGYGGQQFGDVVGNIRLDQAWGGFQVMGAAHEVNATYYQLGAATPVPVNGHPGDSLGWAAGVGLKLNLPMISQGDWFQAQFNATEGALRYLFFTPNDNWGKTDGAGQAWGVLSDCVYGGVAGTTGTGCNLTSAWGFNAGYEHFWVPNLHTSLYGAWYEVKYNNQANAILCTLEGNGVGTVGSGAIAGAGCNNNWSTWGIGSRTQWDVTKTFYLGVEVLYEQLHSATLNGAGGLSAALTPAGTGATFAESSATNWMVSVRAHRDFLP